MISRENAVPTAVSAENIAAVLRGRRSGAGWMALCPAHDDRNPSLSIRESEGRVLVHCHAGCTQSALLGALAARGLWSRRPAESTACGKQQAQNFHAELVAAIADEEIKTGKDAAWSAEDRDIAMESQASIEIEARATQTDGLIVRRASQIKRRPIRWLWPARFARGKVSLVAGDPGLGKSQLMAHIAAVATTGGAWPIDGSICASGSVVFLSAEDDPEDTMGPRLVAAGADLNRIHIVESIRTIEQRQAVLRGLDLKADLDRIDKLLGAIGDVAVLVIDPISAYLGTVDSHKNAEVRGLLAPLAEMAARHSVAVLVVSHFNKARGTDAIHRVTGSVGFIGAARAAYVVAADPSEPTRRLFLPLKNNIGQDQSGLAFRIEAETLEEGIETSKVIWEQSPVTITASEVLSSGSTSETRTAIGDAEEFLKEFLASSPQPSSVIFERAKIAGYAQRTIYRAKDKLGIIATKSSFQGAWEWRLPSKVANPGEDCHAGTLDTLDIFDESGDLSQPWADDS